MDDILHSITGLNSVSSSDFAKCHIPFYRVQKHKLRHRELKQDLPLVMERVCLGPCYTIKVIALIK